MPGSKDALQVKPFRAPVHAALVHLPLACFSVAAVLDLASWLVSGSDIQFQPAAFWSIAAGVVTALVAALFGFADFISIRQDHPARKQALWHMALNVAAVLIFAASLLLRRGQLDADRTPAAALAATLIGYGALMVSGYIGGHMVYNDGIGVGRHRRRTPLPDRTIERTGVAGEFVAVCRADEMQEGEIRRASIAGTVVALARTGDRFFAVQEFCTHRFGPLSEGCIRDGTVMCPWHRSCFDLKTGTVTDGPAKEALRTFEVEVKDGNVRIRVPVATG
ncbi:hypothetical protein DB347_12355 [Opitutaceae bacterium EW11]|nr:hypothetical protein DB347_12355 [Opitutaceae bacterium EW11]